MTDSYADLSTVELRQRLLDAVLADLRGPSAGEREMLDERSVSDRYMLGRLAPRRQQNRNDKDAEEQDAITDEDIEGELATAGVDGEDGITEPETAMAGSMQPNSLGMSFVSAPDADTLQISVEWGRYHREAGKGDSYTTKQGKQRLIWQRKPTAVTLPPVPLATGRFTQTPDSEQAEITVEGLVRRRGDGWHVTVFLVNGQTEPKQNSDSAWIFQVELAVASPDGHTIFSRRPTTAAGDDPEMQGMAMRYRKTVEFAVGHGVAVHAEIDPTDSHRAIRLATATVPVFDVPQTLPFVPAWAGNGHAQAVQHGKGRFWSGADAPCRGV